MNKKILSISVKVGSKLLSGCILTLMFANTVIAAYSPPKKPSRPNDPVSSNSTRTGTCSETTQANLTALAPISHFGQTVSQQPTFAWFVPDTKSYPMELSLYEYSINGKGEEIKSFKFSSQPGIMTFSIPKDEFNFSVGKKYLWQIALLCDTNNPGKDVYTELVIEVVPMPINLASQIAQTTNSIERARIYGKAGFWYDASAETFKSPQNKAFSLTLLEKLADLEAKTVSTSPLFLKKDLQNQASQIKKVIEIERQQ
ncbi:MAG: DUF928 domain-containing protein [Rivularia sp. (in: cyanobacteria)]